ncbi:hypothetical protein FA95DRAFT_1223366 [Auriscalpium vulgare]|uniref:Uncharacterized protein n=1 Tax=Auriscalpium vulgare TaxID=40419 RepID=A0ACB8R2Q8_9AGAM|nr:hypothetical protein FA95DRAFT_1223366 [Auriscalpium vulgare]
MKGQRMRPACCFVNRNIVWNRQTNCTSAWPWMSHDSHLLLYFYVGLSRVWNVCPPMSCTPRASASQASSSATVFFETVTHTFFRDALGALAHRRHPHLNNTSARPYDADADRIHPGAFPCRADGLDLQMSLPIAMHIHRPPPSSGTAIRTNPPLATLKPPVVLEASRVWFPRALLCWQPKPSLSSAMAPAPPAPHGFDTNAGQLPRPGEPVYCDCYSTYTSSVGGESATCESAQRSTAPATHA